MWKVTMLWEIHMKKYAIIFVWEKSLPSWGENNHRVEKRLKHYTNKTYYRTYQIDSKCYQISDMGWNAKIKEHIMWIGREERTEHFSQPNEYEQIRKEEKSIYVMTW